MFSFHIKLQSLQDMNHIVQAIGAFLGQGFFIEYHEIPIGIAGCGLPAAA